MSQTIIILGGAGYIGSHTAKLLAERGYTPIVVDNLSRGQARAVQWGALEQADIRDTEALTKIFLSYKPIAVIHFAAMIEVGESVKSPDVFYDVNVLGTLSVMRAMRHANIRNIIFSSTAAVYGQTAGHALINEDTPLLPINPYGNSKLAAENLIRDMGAAYGIQSVSLRYFNACGASLDLDIGEMHNPETHLIPLVIQTALGLRPHITVFGSDYPTPDGTCIRDYIHVLDLANAHIKAVEYLLGGGQTTALNVGTGQGYSVRQIINTAQKMCNTPFSVIESERRAGDPASLVADTQKIQKTLSWSPEYGLDQIIQSAFNWHDTDTYRNFWNSRTSA
jgi:UDP-glucose-4-epimerase GalE